MSADRSEAMAKKTKTEIADNDFILGTGNYLENRG